MHIKMANLGHLHLNLLPANHPVVLQSVNVLGGCRCLLCYWEIRVSETVPINNVSIMASQCYAMCQSRTAKLQRPCSFGPHLLEAITVVRSTRLVQVMAWVLGLILHPARDTGNLDVPHSSHFAEGVKSNLEAVSLSLLVTQKTYTIQRLTGKSL